MLVGGIIKVNKIGTIFRLARKRIFLCIVEYAHLHALNDRDDK